MLDTLRFISTPIQSKNMEVFIHKRFDSWICEDLKKKLRVCLVTFNVHINKKWNLLLMSFF